MFTASSQLNVTLICGPTDMRKAIDGLCNIVAYDLEKEPCSEHIFVFCGRARDKIKILQWSNNGFWLHYKRLEKGSSSMPGHWKRPFSNGQALRMSIYRCTYLIDN